MRDECVRVFKYTVPYASVDLCPLQYIVDHASEGDEGGGELSSSEMVEQIDGLLCALVNETVVESEAAKMVRPEYHCTRHVSVVARFGEDRVDWSRLKFRPL